MKKYLNPLIVILIVLNMFVWTFALSFEEDKKLKIIFLNVGQGDAIFIEAPNSLQVLIDAGPSENIARALSRHLPYFDREIDIVISTHPDLDHIGGLPTIFERYKVKKYFYYDNDFQSDIILKMNQIINQKNISTEKLIAGDRIILDAEQEIFLDILWPTEKFKTKDRNENSLVIKLIHKNADALLMGDASVKVENILLSEYKNYAGGQYLLNDILKLGHHGSKTSSLEYFLKKVSPQFSIVSAGLDNRYNHPSPDVVNRLNKLKLPFFNTAILGDIIFESDGDYLKLLN